jgi:hypothetical protein
MKSYQPITTAQVAARFAMQREHLICQPKYFTRKIRILWDSREISSFNKTLS